MCMLSVSVQQEIANGKTPFEDLTGKPPESQKFWKGSGPIWEWLLKRCEVLTTPITYECKWHTVRRSRGTGMI